MSQDGEEKMKPIKWGPITLMEVPDWVRSIQFAGSLPDGTILGPVTLFDRDAGVPPVEPDAEPDRPAE